MKYKILFTFMALLLVTGTVELSAQEQKAQKAPLKPALLVIDIQNAYLPYIPEDDRTAGLENINFYIQLFRFYGCPVIRVYHYSKEYGPEQGTEGFEFPSSVLIEPGDPKVIKTYSDGFNRTDLDRVIREKGCNTLFMCGLSATGCVLATWIGAQNYDYQAFLLKDAIMSNNSEYTKNIEEIFGAVTYDIVKLLLENKHD